MVKVYPEPTTLTEAENVLTEIKVDLVALEAKLTKTKQERDKKAQEFKELNTRYNDDIKKAKAGRPSHSSSLPPSAEILALRKEVSDLQTENDQYSQNVTTAQKMIDKLGQQKQVLEDKLKDLQSKQNKETTPEVIKLDFDWQTPAVYLGGFFVVLFTWSWLKSKLKGK